MEEENFDVNAAMAQIAMGFCIKIPKLTKEDINVFTRPQKRVAKKRYHILSFDILDDDEDSFFEITANKQDEWGSARKKKRIRKQLDEPSLKIDHPNSTPIPAVAAAVAVATATPTISTKEKPVEKNSKSIVIMKTKEPIIPSTVSSTSNTSTIDVSTVKAERSVIVEHPAAEVKPLLKPTTTTEVKILKPIPVEVVSYKQPTMNSFKPTISDVPSNNVKSKILASKNDKIGKIRVKSARELGSTVIFLDDDEPPPIKLLPPTHQPMESIAQRCGNITPGRSSNSSTSVVEVDGTSNNAQVRPPNMNIQLIADLYTKFFTPKNQIKIRNVAEILQNIADKIKTNNERIQEINNNNKLSDAEKLMLRYNSYQEFKRNQEASEQKLRDKFQLVMNLFDDDNFETLFQLFFLGTLKILIVNVSNAYKKGTLFKKLLSVLCQSLTNSRYKNDRVFKILKSKDFRDKCIALVQFIEKYSRTELFGMLFLSDADKKLIKNKGVNNDHFDDEKSSQPSKHHNLVNDKQKDSFLLDLLSKESRGVPANNQQRVNGFVVDEQVTKKTYGPASKINHTNNSSSTFNGVGTINHTNNSFKSKPTSNQFVNNYIFTGGKITPVSHSTIELNSGVDITQRSHPGTTTTTINDGYTPRYNNPNGHIKPHPVNSFSTYPSHTSGITPNITVRNPSNTMISYKNNENIQPGAYVNANKLASDNLKKGSTDELRFLLSNNVDVNNYNNDTMTRYWNG